MSKVSSTLPLPHKLTLARRQTGKIWSWWCFCEAFIQMGFPSYLYTVPHPIGSKSKYTQDTVHIIWPYLTKVHITHPPRNLPKPPPPPRPLSLQNRSRYDSCDCKIRINSVLVSNLHSFPSFGTWDFDGTGDDYRKCIYTYNIICHCISF